MRLHEVYEMASYPGNMGVMELVKFFQDAPPELVKKVRDLLDRGASREVWQIVQAHTGVKLQGNQYEHALGEALDIVLVDITQARRYKREWPFVMENRLYEWCRKQ